MILSGATALHYTGPPRISMSHRRIHLVLPLVGAAACTGDLRSYEAPIDIQLSVKPGKKNDIVTGEKGIKSEVGDPFGVFIEDVRRKLGRDPATLELRGAELDIGAGSIGAVVLGEVFLGTVRVLFQLDSTGSNYPVAAGDVAVTTAGSLPLDASFDGDAIPDGDYLDFLGGGFKVSIIGPAAPALTAKPAAVDLQLRLTFAALE
jgi:hypothetical protein